MSQSQGTLQKSGVARLRKPESRGVLCEVVFPGYEDMNNRHDNVEEVGDGALKVSTLHKELHTSKECWELQK